MVAPNREIANRNSFNTSSAMSNQVEAEYISEDIEMDELRGRFAIPSKATSRAILAFSTTSSVPYVERMEAQNNDPDFFFKSTIYNVGHEGSPQ